jgi:hypothetical protein
MGELFTNTLKYKNGVEDKLAIFDGNILVGPVKNTSYGVDTIIAFRRVEKPDDKSIGDRDDGRFSHVSGYAFHFENINSIQVVIDALEEIKADMHRYLEEIEKGE